MTINLPRLHPAQQLIRFDGHRFRVVSAGRRFGKGILGVGECFRRGLEGSKCRFISPSYASDSFQSGWAAATAIANQLPGATIHQQKRMVDFAALGGGWLQYKTAEEPAGLRGEGIDFAVFDEAAHIGDLQTTWEQVVRPSLMDRKGGAFFISTPKGFNYFNELFLRARSDKEWASFQFPTSDNPTIAPDEIAALRASLPSLVARQEVDAEFVQLAGELMARDWFKIIDEAPPAQYVRSYDLAYTTKSTSDYTAGAKVALLDDGTLVIAHMLRGRWEWPEAVRMVSQTAQADGGAVRQGIETVGAQVGFLQTLQREPMLAATALQAVEVHKDKLTRALPLIARAEQGKVALVRGDWNQAFLDEACSFPSGAHDDQIDAVSGALQMLATGNYFVAVV